ncbi:MAG: glycine cleavage system protein GcvH [Candidatus Omnitrophica bacterium]|nr:glycine cleavage system protein GcvH [Candidatus Omnitrophota bacterium]
MANRDALRFTKTHEWFDPTAGAVGITEHAQEEISDVVFVELPNVGTVVRAGQEAAVVESVKAAFSIYAPVAGTITAVNERLRREPALVNTAPHGDGWIFTLKAQDPAAAAALMTQVQYQAWIVTEKDSGGVHAEHS